ncbi:predicted protein [Naegleria gruberi]|uniref:Outer dynein arm-docking complex subunit 4 n=1 Tax=Naegleria gruberi TaxID=5762 RepID=D2VSS5_NAEGR|nr:uncharacterized protein NAEGRDRAFT_51971 [Naegleria gruberi]EFC40169.1 predicted protein [Naegleria gruberi]|eukprot:XP_002672913.1 predicted protein [Naegleria gruberi strain NEG-M]
MNNSGRPSSAPYGRTPTSATSRNSFLNSFDRNSTLNSSSHQQQATRNGTPNSIVTNPNSNINLNNLESMSESDAIITLLTSFLAEGERYMKTREWDKAIVSFTKALEDEPMNKYAYICRSKCFTNIGEFDKAIEDAEKALEIDPKYHRAFLAKAECLYSSGKFEYALVYYYKGYDLRKDIEDFKKGIRKAKIAINESIEQDEIDRAYKKGSDSLNSSRLGSLSSSRPGSASSTFSSRPGSATSRLYQTQTRKVVTPRDVHSGYTLPAKNQLNKNRPSSAGSTLSRTVQRPASAGSSRQQYNPSFTPKPPIPRPMSASTTRPSSARTTYSGTSRPMSATRPKSANVNRKERFLLGEFTKDEDYLNNLLNDQCK